MTKNEDKAILKNPWYRRAARALGIEKFDSTEDVATVKAFMKVHGIEKLKLNSRANFNIFLDKRAVYPLLTSRGKDTTTPDSSKVLVQDATGRYYKAGSDDLTYRVKGGKAATTTAGPDGKLGTKDDIKVGRGQSQKIYERVIKELGGYQKQNWESDDTHLDYKHWGKFDEKHGTDKKRNPANPWKVVGKLKNEAYRQAAYVLGFKSWQTVDDVAQLEAKLRKFGWKLDSDEEGSRFTKADVSKLYTKATTDKKQTTRNPNTLDTTGKNWFGGTFINDKLSSKATDNIPGWTVGEGFSYRTPTSTDAHGKKSGGGEDWRKYRSLPRWEEGAAALGINRIDTRAEALDILDWMGADTSAMKSDDDDDDSDSTYKPTPYEPTVEKWVTPREHKPADLVQMRRLGNTEYMKIFSHYDSKGSPVYKDPGKGDATYIRENVQPTVTAMKIGPQRVDAGVAKWELYTGQINEKNPGYYKTGDDGKVYKQIPATKAKAAPSLSSFLNITTADRSKTKIAQPTMTIK